MATDVAFARGEYQSNEDFLAETFHQQVPKSQVVWLKGDVKQAVKAILGHDYAGLRVRYWHQDDRSAWILEEIGKEQPITFGVVVNQDHIESIKVLTYRESRGYEVRYPAFTQQFQQAKLDGEVLNKHIDGITGATLSVRAMIAIARLALYLDSQIQ
jgi:hypothetical protein